LSDPSRDENAWRLLIRASRECKQAGRIEPQVEKRGNDIVDKERDFLDSANIHPLANAAFEAGGFL